MIQNLPWPQTCRVPRLSDLAQCPDPPSLYIASCFSATSVSFALNLRKRRQIPVVVSQRRSQDNTLFLPDCVPCTTPTPPSSPNVSLCSTARPSRANLQNLIKVPLQSSDLPNQLCVCLFNAKSVGVARKCTAIADFLADHDVDVMVLTETWLKESGDESKIADLTPPGYKLFSFPRQLTASIKGGSGIAVIMKDCLASHTSINTTLSFTHTSFEGDVKEM
ncbi:hypothetical protein ACOMHN_062952 [Nucella lapillus]